MSELVNEYHPSLYENSKKNPKDKNDAASPDGKPSQEDFAADGLTSVSVNISPNIASTPNWNVDPLKEIASPSLELELERELSESLSDTKDNSENPELDAQEEEIEPSNDDTERLERACINLIKQAHEDRSPTPDLAPDRALDQATAQPADTLENPSDTLENFERDLAEVQANNTAFHDQVVTPKHDMFFTTTTQQNPDATNPGSQIPPEVPQAHIVEKQSNWKWRAALGSTVILVALTATGSMLRVQDHPAISGKIETLTGLVNPQTTETASTEVNVEEVLPNKIAGLSETSISGFTDTAEPLVTPVADGQTELASSTPQTSSATEPVVSGENELDVLKVNLQLEEAHMAGLRKALDTETAENLPKLLEDTVKSQGQIISLKKQIAALQLGTDTSQSATDTPEAAIARIVEPEAAGGQQASDTNAWDSTLVAYKAEPEATDPLLVPEKSKTRDPAAVELAMNATPGLLALDATQRQQLSEKLVNGECLVPALSSIYSQVPALVMRDMVRQFDGEC